MIDFGYSIHQDRQIDFDHNNKSLAYYLYKYDNSFNLCISCGTCSATCSAAQFTDFSPRKVFLLIQRGETKGLLQEMKKCMFCGKCQLACPKGVNTRNIIFKINQVIENSLFNEV